MFWSWKSGFVLEKSLSAEKYLCLSRQLELDGIPGQFRVTAHIHFFEYVTAMGIDRLGTQGKFPGNQASRLSRGDHAHHLVLPVGEGVVTR